MESSGILLGVVIVILMFAVANSKILTNLVKAVIAFSWVVVPASVPAGIILLLLQMLKVNDRIAGVIFFVSYILFVVMIFRHVKKNYG